VAYVEASADEDLIHGFGQVDCFLELGFVLDHLHSSYLKTARAHGSCARVAQTRCGQGTVLDDDRGGLASLETYNASPVVRACAKEAVASYLVVFVVSHKLAVNMKDRRSSNA